MLGAAHVDPPGQSGVRAPRFLDECLQPFVRLPRHERPCGHVLPPAVRSPGACCDPPEHKVPAGRSLPS
ncbi:hypothetical protein SHJG_4746 [Streptomyces hygroscopicus subsp. jinggangensis 5008]|nr:hypothetical protein SHJG_4746 [Streptomyces hygroscopicus subsp. jinggangensis 5008]AGF64172.1 hypothetical protein SHJGH_4508 [Streptomyces hygroscopicus subsp. jinggangensis TL01]